MKKNTIKMFPQTACLFFVPKNDSFFSNGIYFYQRYAQGHLDCLSKLIHVGLVKDWPYGIHSTCSRGVHETEKPIYELYPNAVIMQHIDLIGNAKSGLRNKIMLDSLSDARKGVKYDFVNILKFVFRIIPAVLSYIISYKDTEDIGTAYQYCAEHCIRKYNGRGVGFYNITNPERASVADLASAKELIIVGNAIDFK